MDKIVPICILSVILYYVMWQWRFCKIWFRNCLKLFKIHDTVFFNVVGKVNIYMLSWWQLLVLMKWPIDFTHQKKDFSSQVVFWRKSLFSDVNLSVSWATKQNSLLFIESVMTYQHALMPFVKLIFCLLCYYFM